MSQSSVLTLPTAVLLINNTGIPPVSGTLGEQIRQFTPQGSAIALSESSVNTLASVTLTPGIWDMTAVASFTTSDITGTCLIAGISTTNNSFTGSTVGDTLFYENALPQNGADESIVIPTHRVNVTTNTTYYLVAKAIFSSGTISGYGRISGVRVC
jgi:hypothetical protein